MGGRLHANQAWQRHHGHGREAADLDLWLAELRGFRGQNKIAKRRQLHAAPQAIAVHSGNGQAIGRGQTAKDRMKRRKHFLHTPGSVIGNVGARAKCFHARALENHEIAFRQGALKRCVERFHHRDVENVQRHAIERDPSAALLDAQLNGFVMSSHAYRALEI